VHVLRHYCDALGPAAVFLDLQVVPPNPRVESGGADVCEIDSSVLLAWAAAATAVVDGLVAEGRLVEEAVDDHDVRGHYPSGAALVEDFAPKKRNVPPESVPVLEAIDAPCTVREPCRLRRLRVI